jgi:hypothetical protein
MRKKLTAAAQESGGGGVPLPILLLGCFATAKHVNDYSAVLLSLYVI